MSLKPHLRRYGVILSTISVYLATQHKLYQWSWQHKQLFYRNNTYFNNRRLRKSTPIPMRKTTVWVIYNDISRQQLMTLTELGSIGRWVRPFYWLQLQVCEHRLSWPTWRAHESDLRVQTRSRTHRVELISPEVENQPISFRTPIVLWSLAGRKGGVEVQTIARVRTGGSLVAFATNFWP